MFVLIVGASDARPADHITITFLDGNVQQPGFDILIPNFERVYPNITVDVTYTASTTDLYQLETTELAAGNGPDLISTFPGCGLPVSVCTLAKSGYLAPMLKEPWVRRSLPLITSLSKYGQGLFAFEPTLSAFGMWTNDALFAKLGLKVPTTFSSLLAVCRKAKAAGIVPLLVPGLNATQVSLLVTDLAVANVYGQDKQWPRELRAGTASFQGTSGWQQALQEFGELSSTGCFEPGMAGTASTTAQFAEGQGLMMPGLNSSKATIDVLSPRFGYHFVPFAGVSIPTQTRTLLNLPGAISVNAHSSAQNQAAAQTFVDFLARPKQDALFAQIQGGLTQYEFLKGQIPSFMPSFATIFGQHQYVLNPIQTWWNAGVVLALQQNEIGLITGQRSTDDVLNAMDAAWKQGPS